MPAAALEEPFVPAADVPPNLTLPKTLRLAKVLITDQQPLQVPLIPLLGG